MLYILKIQAIENIVHPCFLRDCSTNDAALHLDQLARLVAEEDVDLEVISSLLTLLLHGLSHPQFASCILVDRSEEEVLQLAITIGLMLSNILLAVSGYWPCTTCRPEM